MRTPRGPLGTREPRRLSLTMLVVVGALLALTPAGAGAATLDDNDYTANPGETNNLTVTDYGATLTYVDPAVAITGVNGCTPAGPNLPGAPVTCPEGNIVIRLGDGSDQTTFVGPVDVGVYQYGGTGSDTLRGGASNTANGMDGEDGADILAGGASPNDYVDYRPRTAAVNVSLDDVANDGAAGEGDNALSSVEDIATGTGNDTIAGSAGINQIFADAGNDTVSAGAGADYVFGDVGNDTVSGDAGNDVVDGDLGADTVSGGEGDDDVYAGRTPDGVADGADSVSGGPGIDYTDLAPFGPAPASAPIAVSVTLDDVANDGIAGEGDNYHSDIEDVNSLAGGDDTLVGGAGINILQTDVGNDTITGGAGNDVLQSFSGNDTINARDGYADRVDCGAGVDTAVVDTLDQVGRCETVQIADVGNANDIPEDNPPGVAFAAPGENALVPGSGASVTVNATDDHGIARVVLIDDGQPVGTDTVAPYVFAYVPQGDDLGDNTLIAMAFDSRNQSATAIRNVRVGKFDPTRVTETVTPSRDRTRPFRFRVGGAVRRPAGVSAAQGCSAATVTVTVKKGVRTVAKRTVKLTKTCTYAVTVSVGSRGRLTVKSRFNGNTLLKARSSASRSVRSG
jgi:Ca2+-binding RTX toxin-like protein